MPSRGEGPFVLGRHGYRQQDCAQHRCRHRVQAMAHVTHSPECSPDCTRRLPEARRGATNGRMCLRGRGLARQETTCDAPRPFAHAAGIWAAMPAGGQTGRRVRLRWLAAGGRRGAARCRGAPGPRRAPRARCSLRARIPSALAPDRFSRSMRSGRRVWAAHATRSSRNLGPGEPAVELDASLFLDAQAHDLERHRLLLSSRVLSLAGPGADSVPRRDRSDAGTVNLARGPEFRHGFRRRGVRRGRQASADLPAAVPTRWWWRRPWMQP